MHKLKGKIIILTAPSGSGKTTIAHYLLERFGQLSFSISATTRKPRAGEEHGVQYFFVSRERFNQFIAEDNLFEYQEVYPNQFYGTLYSELERIWSEGKVALFDIDVKGACFVEQNYPDNVLSIYVKTSSLEILRKRLENRGTESSEAIQKRLERASQELEYAKYFDYVITNDKLELAQRLIADIVEDFIAQGCSPG